MSTSDRPSLSSANIKPHAGKLGIMIPGEDLITHLGLEYYGE